MEKQIFLISVLGICFVRCCNNFQYVSLARFNGSAQCAEADTPRGGGGHQGQVAGFINDFAILTMRSSLSEDSECGADVRAILREARRFNLWALRFLDSSAKLPSGILNGNLNQFGDFDECLSSKGRYNVHPIQGKYCLANVGIKFEKNQAKLKPLDDAIHSNRMVRNKFRDPGHRIPKFETFKIGVCVPASCGSQQVETALTNHLKEISKNSFAAFEVSVSDEVCYVRKENEISMTAMGVRFMFALTASAIVLGTLVDLNRIKINNKTATKLLLCFSLKRNLTLLLKTDSTEDDIKCVHGARFLNALALLLSHKQIALLFSPILNRTQMAEAFNKSWTMIGRAAILYTDSFILFSGLLVSYSMIKDLDNKKIINFKDKFLSRIVRLLPNLLAVILFCTYIMEDMGSGPQWGLVVSKYTNLCKKYMWRNFLFVHNYFGFENMCLTHTHQLGIDMQLFMLAPLFIYFMWRTPKLGILFATAVSVLSTWLRYDITHRQHLSTILYYGISVEQLWKTANLSYILPTHRLTVYLMGIVLGYYLRRGGRGLNFNFFQATIGWVLAGSAGLLAVFEPYEAAFKDYVYNANQAARFNAFAPILWSAFLCWGAVACVNGAGGILNSILSWKYFTIFTRISYAVYLTQFPVFFYNVGIERTARYFRGIHSLLDVEELIVILIASVVLTLAFDIPFQELKKAMTTTPARTHGERVQKSCENAEENERQRERGRLQTFGT